MERGFAAAGSAPAVADTPAEVLARATRAGLVRSEPAETLTGLFRRARYSTYPMTSTDSRVAADALDRDARRPPRRRPAPDLGAADRVNGRRALAGAATVVGIGAALVAGYAAAGATGLIDVAAVATLGVLVVARGTLRGEKPRSVRPGRQRRIRGGGRRSGRRTSPPTPRSRRTWSGRGCRGGTTSTACVPG